MSAPFSVPVRVGVAGRGLVENVALILCLPKLIIKKSYPCRQFLGHTIKYDVAWQDAADIFTAFTITIYWVVKVNFVMRNVSV